MGDRQEAAGGRRATDDPAFAPGGVLVAASKGRHHHDQQLVQRLAVRGCLARSVTRTKVVAACPGCGAARNEVERRIADPGPPRSGTVPGLQRTIRSAYAALRPGHKGASPPRYPANSRRARNGTGMKG